MQQQIFVLYQHTTSRCKIVGFSSHGKALFARSVSVEAVHHVFSTPPPTGSPSPIYVIIVSHWAFELADAPTAFDQIN